MIIYTRSREHSAQVSTSNFVIWYVGEAIVRSQGTNTVWCFTRRKPIHHNGPTCVRRVSRKAASGSAYIGHSQSFQMFSAQTLQQKAGAKIFGQSKHEQHPQSAKRHGSALLERNTRHRYNRLQCDAEGEGGIIMAIGVIYFSMDMEFGAKSLKQDIGF